MRFFWVYLGIGIALAIVCDRRARHEKVSARTTSALLSIAAWPLWAPLSLLSDAKTILDESSTMQRIRNALAEAQRAVIGTSLEGFLSESLVSQMLVGLEQVERRHAELCSLLRRPEYQVAICTDGLARVQADSVQRLYVLKSRDERLLSEMAELAEALRTQLWVARFSGQDERTGPAVKDLIGDLAAKVESMDAWFELSS